MTIPNPKHNITKSMVGPWPLAPHHVYLLKKYVHDLEEATWDSEDSMQLAHPFLFNPVEH